MFLNFLIGVDFLYSYNFYLGYQKQFAGFPFLGEVQYEYPLNKGDQIIVANEFFEAICSIAADVSIPNLRFRQTYKIAAIHHWVDSESKPDVYLVTDGDYSDRFIDGNVGISEIKKIMENYKLEQEEQLKIIKEFMNLEKATSTNEINSTYRKLMDKINQVQTDTDTFIALADYAKVAWGFAIKQIQNNFGL